MADAGQGERPVEPDRAGTGPRRGEPRRSPLHDRHVAHGAVLVPFAGWLMPLRYASELAEHHAVRRRAGVFDLSHMGEIELRGTQVGAALDHALVGELSSLETGQARYTMACEESGGVLDDLVVYRLGAERYLVVANAANTEVVLTLLQERSAGFSVTVEDATSRYALVAIQGPRALHVLTPLVDAPIADLRSYRALQATAAGAPALVARTGYTGEDGFELFVDADQGGPLFEALLAAGASDEVLPAGLAARDSLRLEAGMPLYGNELTTAVTPYEAGLGRVVRLEKRDDFVGRAALERRHDAGGRQRLVGLLGEGTRSPRAGQAVLAPVAGGEGAGGGGEGAEPVGTVTSGAPSPTLGRPVAMAYVTVGHAEPGTRLLVDVRGRHEPVVVTKLPFYRGERPAGSGERPTGSGERPTGSGERPQDSAAKEDA